MNFKKIFLFSAIVPVFLAGVLYYLMKADLLGGKLELRGPDFYEDIDVLTVERGLKVVQAKTYNGAIYGLGFVHARDRLW